MSGPGPAAGSGVRACGLDEIGGGRPVHLDLSGCPVCLVRTAGTVYALRDECTHEPVPLPEGEVAGGTIECWLHGSRSDLAAGRVLCLPATRPAAVFAARVDGGDVCVRLPPGRETATG